MHVGGANAIGILCDGDDRSIAQHALTNSVAS